MISKIIIDSIIKNAKPENKDVFINAAIEDYNRYGYNEYKVTRCLEILSGGKSALISEENINIDYIEKHMAKYIYNGDKWLFKNIKLEWINNIEGEVTISFDKIEKVNEERDDINYITDTCNINWLSNPTILK